MGSAASADAQEVATSGFQCSFETMKSNTSAHVKLEGIVNLKNFCKSDPGVV